jgi:Heparinase II/III-like protein/Heparinase II/III N-terminus
MTTALRRARTAGQLAKTLGPGWVAFRVKHAARLRAGWLERKLPATAWEAVSLSAELSDPALADHVAYGAYRRSAAPPFFFRAEDRAEAAALLRAWDEGLDSRPVRYADNLARGVVRYFSCADAELGDPPAWHRNPFTGQEAPADRHWSRLDDFGYGDIKVIWEPSRFAFTYDLVRAYWRTGDSVYGERFWRLVESWRTANPPQRGANWKCGQETSFRVMAWCFGLYGFLDSPATTDERLVMLAEMVALSGRRIEAMLDYALSQQNNHGISEGMGLWTIGSLFPELRSAPRWREQGRSILERLGRELIYDDGAFSQHSLNYHRLMLHDYVWSIRLGELHDRRFSPALYERVARAVEFLYQLQDESTGRLPCYGSNDGALILPLSSVDYQDFRPVVQSARYLVRRTRTYESGPWDEEVFWLFGRQAVGGRTAAPPRIDLRTAAGGYVTLRCATGFALTRCARFRHRPGHADLLHVDLWWRGINIALDPGTYSYNAPAPWHAGLADTTEHNTVAVDGRSQMAKAARFLWLPWASGTQRYYATSVDGRLAYWEGEHDGYRRLPSPVVHRRGILKVGDEHWLVVDDLQGCASHTYSLHWLLADAPYRLGHQEPAVGTDRHESITLVTPAGSYEVKVGSSVPAWRVCVVRGEADGCRGWRSAYYLDRAPALSLRFDVDAATVRFVTAFGPAGYDLWRRDDLLTLAAPELEARMQLGISRAKPLVGRAWLGGEFAAELEVEA